MNLKALNSQINSLLEREVEVKEYNNNELSIEEYISPKNNILVVYTKDDDCFDIMSRGDFIFSYEDKKIFQRTRYRNSLERLYVSKALPLFRIMKKYYL